MSANADMIHYWNEVAGAKWVANQDRLDRLMTPLTDALLTSAAPQAGERIVDVGCGCGEVTLRLATTVDGGEIRAIDVSKPMLAHAAARRSRLSGIVARVEWVEADASAYPFQPVASLLVSRFGVMFFDDRPRAFANLRSALASGGRFVFLTWRRRSDCEWMQVPLDWIASALPTPAEAPGEPGPFGLADADAVTAELEAAGFEDVVADKVDCPLVIGQGADNAQAVEDALAMLADTGPAAALIRDAEPPAKAQALDLLRARLQDRVEDGRVLLEGACWLYSGSAGAGSV